MEAVGATRPAFFSPFRPCVVPMNRISGLLRGEGKSAGQVHAPGSVRALPLTLGLACFSTIAALLLSSSEGVIILFCLPHWLLGTFNKESESSLKNISFTWSYPGNAAIFDS